MSEDLVKYVKGRGNAPQPLRFKSGAYRIEHKETGELYIGSTDDLSRRHSEHYSMLSKGKHSCPALQQAFNADPNPSNFEFRCKPTDSREEAYSLEEKWIGEARSSGKLLNIAEDVRASGRGAIRSEETRRRLSESRRGSKDSEETRARKAEFLNSIPRHGANNPGARGITVDGVHYGSIVEAANQLGVLRDTLRKQGYNVNFPNVVLDDK